MGALDELCAHISGTSRAIVISDADVDLRAGGGDVTLFILKIDGGSLAAGGRGGGFGERRVTAAFCFTRKGGSWFKTFEANEGEAEKFEVPYHVSRLPMTLGDGTETMGYGVVDPELVRELSSRTGATSSA